MPHVVLRDARLELTNSRQFFYASVFLLMINCVIVEVALEPRAAG